MVFFTSHFYPALKEVHLPVTYSFAATFLFFINWWTFELIPVKTGFQHNDFDAQTVEDGCAPTPSSNLLQELLMYSS